MSGLDRHPPGSVRGRAGRRASPGRFALRRPVSGAAGVEEPSGEGVGSGLRVAVVGGGASGALTALHLAREAARAGVPLALSIIEPGQLGRGVAYSTENHQHRLNVPAAGMSVLPEDPGHFVRWLRADYDPAFAPGGFAPRAVFGRYLSGTLGQQLQEAAGVVCTQHRSRAVDLRGDSQRAVITLASHEVLEADAVVLALGHGAVTSAWVPASLLRSARFVADPWRPGALPELDPGAAVLLVGTGLTMVDIAMSYRHCQIQAVSRHGQLPLAHVPDPPVPVPVSLPETALSPASVRRLVFDRIRELDGDWRTAVDGFRPVTQQIWSQLLDDAGRRQLLPHAQRRWEHVRHRMAPELGAQLSARREEGLLTVRAASVAAATDSGGSLLVELTDATRLRADLVVNCTGRPSAAQSRDDPLVAALLSRGSAGRDPLGLGFATDRGRLVSADQLPAWTLGPLRRGELWESTAIPEIRDQAAAIARSVLARARG
jgi:uncharacterized NAD(P)/FAD-binding protein YdhS